MMKIIDNSSFFFSTIFIVTISMIIRTVHGSQPNYSNSTSTSTILNPKYRECKTIQKCGNFTLTYPFFSSDVRPRYCGYPGFELEDCESEYSGPTFIMKTTTYAVTKINYSESTITLFSEAKYGIEPGYLTGGGLWMCPDSFGNTTIDFTHFEYTSEYQNITFFYHCDDQSPLPKPMHRNLTLYSSCDNYSIVGYYLTKKLEAEYGLQNLLSKCQSWIFIPTLIESIKRMEESLSSEDVIEAMTHPLELRWNAVNDRCLACLNSGGVCGSLGVDTEGARFVCHYQSHDEVDPGTL